MKYFLGALLMSISLALNSQNFSDVISLDIQVLKSEVYDSLGLERVLEKVLEYTQEPLISLRYVTAYEELVKIYPNIPNRLDRIYFLKGNRYNSLAWSNNQSNIPQALLFIDSALIWHDKADSKIGYWQDQYGLGVIYRNKGENEKALKYFDAYYKNYLNPFDSVFIANVQFQRASVFTQLGQLEKATEAIFEAIKLEDSMGRQFSLATNYNTLAIIKRKAKLYDEIIPIYDKALDIHRLIGDLDGQANILYNKSNFYSERGLTKEAFEYLNDALSLAKGENLLSYIYEGIGTYYLRSEKSDSAEVYLNKSFDLRKASGSDREIYIIRHKIGKLEALKGNNKKAINHFEYALRIAVQQDEKDKIVDITYDLARALQQVNNHIDAAKYYVRHIEARDSMLSTTIAERVEGVRIKYETDKKEQEISLLNTKNELQNTQLAQTRNRLVILFAGTLLLGGLLFRLSDLNKRIKRALNEKDTLLREIHHRVKNNLQVISALLTLQSAHLKDTQAKSALKEGQDRVQSMALIHKDLYQHDNLRGVNTKDYLEQLIENLIHSYHISEGDVEVKMDIEEINLDVDTMIPMGLMINELISNALKYAFVNNNDNILSISLREKSNQLLLMIADNGKGVEDINIMKNQSFGYSLVQSFAHKLNADLQIVEDQGLRINLIIKNYHKV